MKKNSKKKLIAIILITLLSVYSILGLVDFGSNTSSAINSGFCTDIGGIDEARYPGFRSRIQALQNDPAFSNWTFKLYYTGLDWNEAVINQLQGHHGSPRALFQYRTNWRDGDWHCEFCARERYDNGTWRCASFAAVAYIKDPRWAINGDFIFKFKDISDDPTINFARLQAAVSSTFLNDDPKFINAILNVSRQMDMNPFFIASRILQEQGHRGSVLSAGQGWNNQYRGFYNFFNIGATGHTDEEVILNGLRWAAHPSRNWDTPERSIEAGIRFLANNYVAWGQNTAYFQKFNVVSNPLFQNQYMQNIMAAQTEGEAMRGMYRDAGMLNGHFTFIIPVFENMPTALAPRPNASAEVRARNFDQATLRVNGTLALRSAPNGRLIRHISDEARILVLERATTRVNGMYWDKVIAFHPSPIPGRRNVGATGFMARGSADGSRLWINTHTWGADTIARGDGNANDPPPIDNSPNNAFRLEEASGHIVMEPRTRLSNITNAGHVITGATQNGVNVLERDLVGTGTILTFGDGRIFTVIKMGDVNGDGYVDARDATRVLRYSIGQYSLANERRKAGDLLGNGEIDARSATRMLRSDLRIYTISI